MPIEQYKYYGLISIATVWAGLIFMVYKWRGDKSMSFSLHAAADRQAYMFYLSLFLLTLPPLLLFVVFWYVPTLGLPEVFSFIAVLGVVCQLIAGIVPDMEGKQRVIHRLSAYGMSLVLMVLVGMVAWFGEIGGLMKAFCLVALIVMASLWILVVGLKKKQDAFLLYQAIYVALFHIVILTTAYLS